MNEEIKKVEISFEQIGKLNENLCLSQFKNAKFSALFSIQMFIARENRIDISAIIDEIKNLEGLSKATMTKEASQFTQQPLKGLWHKHYFQAAFMLKNIGNHWGINNKKQTELPSIINKLIMENSSEYFTDELATKLAHVFTVGAYKDRASQKQITGEWIIFAKYKNKNYYLALAKHDDGDENIYHKIHSSCSAEYPFLFS